MSKSIEYQHLQLRNTSLLNFQASITLLTKGTAPLPQVTYRTYRSILLEHLQQLHHLSRSNWKLWLGLSRSVAVAWCVDCVAMCRLLTLLLLKGHCHRLVSIIAWLCSLRWSMLAQQICVSLHHLNCPHLFPSSASGSMLSKSKALGKWCLVERSWHFNPCSNKTLRPNDSKKRNAKVIYESVHVSNALSLGSSKWNMFASENPPSGSPPRLPHLLRSRHRSTWNRRRRPFPLWGLYLRRAKHLHGLQMAMAKSRLLEVSQSSPITSVRSHMSYHIIYI